MSERRIGRVIVLDDEGEKIADVRRVEELWRWKTFAKERGSEDSLREAVEAALDTVQENLQGLVRVDDDAEGEDE